MKFYRHTIAPDITKFFSKNILWAIAILCFCFSPSNRLIAQADCSLDSGWTLTYTLSGTISSPLTLTSQNIFVPSGGVIISADVSIITSEMDMRGGIVISSGATLTIDETHLSTLDTTL